MLSEQLQTIRKRAGISQKALAEKLYVSQQAVGKWERNESTPNPETIAKIAEIFGVTTDYLIGRDEAPKGETVIWEGNEYRTVGKWIPVLGSVPAGVPIQAIEDITDYEEITPEMAANGEYFALKIKGNSMEPKISDGDVVIVRLQDDVDSGDTAIVLVNGDEATCKKIKKTPDGVMLIPTNPDYEPWFYTNEEVVSKPVRILGKVVELRAKF